MGSGTSRRATMQDVAERAEVSIATVSRALSGNRPMSADLRERVQRVARELDYRVNLLGRGLRQRRTSSIGLIVPDLDNPFFSALAQHVSRSFGPSGVDVFVYSADGDLALERRGIQSFIGRQVDGLVVVPFHEINSADNLALASASVATIQLDRRVPSVRAHFIGCDNRYGMKLVAGHVREAVDVKAQPVIFVGATPTSSSAHERLDGFVKAFPSSRQLLGSFSFEWGQAAAGQLLDTGVRSATIVTAADIIAVGVMASLQSRGIAVPEEFRVVGFDGIGVSSLAHPALTTVRQPIEAMTQTIFDLMVQALDDGPPDDIQSLRLKPEMVVRDSSPGVREVLEGELA